MSNFDRRQLRYFVAVAEELHFGNAARRLYISQPPLSQQIAALETDLGVSLFTRSKRKVEITAAGQQFLHDARLILADMQKAASQARAAAAGQTGTLRIGLNYSTPINPIFSALTRHFTKLYPNVRFEMHENSSGKQLEGLLHRTLDLCFIWPTRDDTSPDITLIPLSPDELRLAVGREHSLARKPRVGAADFHGLTFFLTPRQTRMDFFDSLMKACHKAGVEPIIRTDTIQFSFIMNIAVTGQGIGFVPEFLHRIKPRELVLRPLDVVPKSLRLFPLSLTYRTHDTSPLVHNFAAVARNVLKEMT